MGQAASKAQEAHARAKSKPKNTRSVQQQKIKTAAQTGMLALPDRKLKSVPSDVLELTGLRTLDLSSNRIESIPAELSALTGLKTLKLASNALTTLPDLSKLTALTTLILDGNAIASLPNALPPNLAKLSLKGNQLSTIPLSVTALGALKELDLAENNIAQVPDHVAQLSELQDLTLDKNALTLLPPVLASCPKLKVLSARGNRLTGKTTGGATLQQSVAVEILDTSAVHIMNLEGNPMTKFDLEAMAGIESFLHRRTLLKNKEIHGGLSTDTSLCGLD